MHYLDKLQSPILGAISRNWGVQFLLSKRVHFRTSVDTAMKPALRVLAAVGSALLAAMTATDAACAQKSGRHIAGARPRFPQSLSMHEEADAVPARATMGLFNNMFDQHAKQNNMQSIVPDLATGWSWSEGNATDLPVARGGQMARRQAFDRRGCQMHLGSAHR